MGSNFGNESWRYDRDGNNRSSIVLSYDFALIWGFRLSFYYTRFYDLDLVNGPSSDPIKGEFFCRKSLTCWSMVYTSGLWIHRSVSFRGWGRIFHPGKTSSSHKVFESFRRVLCRCRYSLGLSRCTAKFSPISCFYKRWCMKEVEEHLQSLRDNSSLSILHFLLPLPFFLFSRVVSSRVDFFPSKHLNLNSFLKNNVTS